VKTKTQNWVRCACLLPCMCASKQVGATGVLGSQLPLIATLAPHTSVGQLHYWALGRRCHSVFCVCKEACIQLSRRASSACALLCALHARWRLQDIESDAALSQLSILLCGKACARSQLPTLWPSPPACLQIISLLIISGRTFFLCASD
jgi:hypothetical protein